MIDRDELWRRVQTALDARLDPLEDAGVVEALLEQPGEYRSVELLTGRLARIERSATSAASSPVERPAVQRGPRRVIGWAATAAVAAASVALLLRARPEAVPAPASPAGGQPAPSLAHESRILRWKVSHERRAAARPEPARAPESNPAADAATGSRVVRLDVRVEHLGQRRGGTRVVLGHDGTYSITRSAGSPASAGAPLLAATLADE